VVSTGQVDGAREFFAACNAILERVQASQIDAIRQSATAIAEAASHDGLLFTLGTGHSYCLAMEAFARAGGLVPVQQVVCSNLSMVDGSGRSGRTERLEGYAACILADYDMRPGDVMLVVSNSGRNAVPIEAAMIARERGLKVIVLTNLAHSRSVPSRHSSGMRLCDVADIVLDNCGVPGDAVVAFPQMPQKVAATSTVAGAMIVESVVAEAVSVLLARDVTPPIRISANVDDPLRAVVSQRSAALARSIKHV
jgi:uncharacterized phosphosugar-binding protein